MAISLTKGGNVNLSKEAPGISKMTIGLGWNPRSTDGQSFDLDAIAFLLKADDKVLSTPVIIKQVRVLAMTSKYLLM
jgi:tellurium resistance protein TerD